MLTSRDISAKASMKEYSTSGDNIPLKKNWSDTWCTLPHTFDNVFNEILNLEVRNDDVFVVTFMRCGTTWMQECAWLLLNNLDYEKAYGSPIWIRSPFIDQNGVQVGAPNRVELCNNTPTPRLIKSHMPANLLPLQIWEKKPKIIYVARNVKDVIVSAYHFDKGLGHSWSSDNIHDYVNDFLDNKTIYTHFWTHIVDFWKMRNEPFVFFVTYEEMQRDLPKVLQRLCLFLERPQLTEKELENAMKHLSFNNMKENLHDNLITIFKQRTPKVNENFRFLRRGIVGSFKDELTPQLQEKINRWTQEFLGKHGLTEEDIFGKLL